MRRIASSWGRGERGERRERRKVMRMRDSVQAVRK
jgi:hypothetical protein